MSHAPFTDADQGKASSPAADPVTAALFGASMVVMITAARTCDRDWVDCEDEYAYAVALGVVSVILTLLLLILNRVSAATADTIGPVVSIFLCLWWVVGAGVTTFKKPFRFTGNGYFGVWMAAILSVALAYQMSQPVRTVVESMVTSSSTGGKAKQLVVLTLVASLVEMIAAAVVVDEMGENDSDEDKKNWAVAVGAISSFVCILLLAVPFLARFIHFVGFALGVLWVFGVGVLTFDSPFTGTGNGFFASWIAFFASWALTYVAMMSSTATV